MQRVTDIPIGQPQGLIDNHGRTINYVRLSVTDRCNLRCSYCMPEKMKFLPRNEILSYEEMERLMEILAARGINKVRITGGEPFVRKGLMEFLGRINAIEGINRIHITTNGVTTLPYIPRLKELGIAGVNLSLDTLDPQRFREITRRDNFDEVMESFQAFISHNIPLKVNMVVMESLNTDDILPMALLSKDNPADIRFIEEMPFNGSSVGKQKLRWNHKQILTTLKDRFPSLKPVSAEPHSTSTNYQINGHQGTVGIIAGFSRTFCGSCNRIRVTAQGQLQTCLYGDHCLDLKQLLRSDTTDEDIFTAISSVINNRFVDGWEAQKHRKKTSGISTSMSLIGG